MNYPPGPNVTSRAGGSISLVVSTAAKMMFLWTVLIPILAKRTMKMTITATEMAPPDVEV
jgi:hypothetical protein